MTLLVVWASVDTHGVSAVYVASDSRVTWDKNGNDRWDYARKVFTIYGSPDILGYCGDVLFTSQVLSQITSLAENKALFDENATGQQKFDLISNAVKYSFLNFPKKYAYPNFTIVYCTREQDGLVGNFVCHELSFSDGEWATKILPLPKKSDVVEYYGSGKGEFKNKLDKRELSDYRDISAGIFVSVCDVINGGEKVTVGGAPQLVGIYRKGPSKIFGIINDQERYILGIKSNSLPKLSSLEWRNELFERCDGTTLLRIQNAQRQPRPKNF